MAINLSFQLSDKQMEKYLKWCDETLKDVKPDNLGVRESFVFIPCSAGIGVKAICGEHQIDLTEYDKLNKK